MALRGPTSSLEESGGVGQLPSFAGTPESLSDWNARDVHKARKGAGAWPRVDPPVPGGGGGRGRGSA